MKRNAVAWAALVLAGLAFLNSQMWVRPLPASRQIPSAGQKTAKDLSEAFEAVADFVKPSVVQISVEKKAGGRSISPRGPQGEVPKEFEDMLKKFFGPDFDPGQGQGNDRFNFGTPNPKAHGTGSGFVYDDRGHILTNYHVVDAAGRIEVRFHDGAKAEAKVIGGDKAADVAVIKVENVKYPPIVKGESSKLRVGEWVMAVGSPFGLSQSVTAGIVSATERSDVAITDYNQLIQTDAAINPGNSGGPLVDMEGKVVGINTAIVTGSMSNAGVGFAIPFDFATAVADRIVKNGKVGYARIGITVGPLDPTLAKQFGVSSDVKGLLVEQVVSDSPAEKAGLRKGDVVTAFDNKPAGSSSSFRMRVALSEIGKTYDLTYYRDGKERHAQVTLGSAEIVDARYTGVSPNSSHKEPVDSSVSSSNSFGLSVQNLTPEIAGQLGYEKAAKGVLVKEVKDGSPAEIAGIEPGDLITQVVKDRSPKDVADVSAFNAAIAKADEVALFVKSPKGEGRFVGLSKSSK